MTKDTTTTPRKRRSAIERAIGAEEKTLIKLEEKAAEAITRSRRESWRGGERSPSPAAVASAS